MLSYCLYKKGFIILIAHTYLFIATVLIASSFIVSSELSGIIDPISLTLYRFIVALTILSVIFVKKEYRQNFTSSILRAFTIGIFYAFYFIAMFKALETTTVLNTTSIYTLIPFVTAILSIFFFKEKITKKQFVAYMVAMVGTFIVIFKADFQLFLNFSFNSGDIIFLFGSLSMAFYSIFLKLFHRKEDKSLVFVFNTLLGGSIAMFVIMQVLGISLEWNKVEDQNLYYVLYLAIATTIITLFLFQKSAPILGPKKTMAYVYFSPAIVALMMYFWTDATMSLSVMMGVAISLVATVILLKD